MIAFRETNVRILQVARDALDRVASQLGFSRDATVRHLLDEHLAAQEAVDELERLTHISTVMRHPLTPPGRGSPRPGVQLRLRLGEGVAERARGVSLCLPGQHVRAWREYQARLLTDAVTSAIARRAEFADETLDGLMPMIRHGAALGLWRLAAAAVRTRTERDLFVTADRLTKMRLAASSSRSADRIERLAGVLREEDVGWLAVHRFEAVQHIVRKLLPTGAIAMEKDLFQQDSPMWTRLMEAASHPGRRGRLFGGFKGQMHSFDGRGGAAVWRAKRRLDRAEMVRWLRETVGAADGRSLLIQEPGWTLRLPDGWQPFQFRAGASLSDRWRAHVEGRRVLQIEDGAWPLLWPAMRHGEDGEPEPVPGLDLVIKAGGRRSPEDLAELLLVQLASHRAASEGKFDDDWELHPIEVPAHVAFHLGLVGEEMRDALVDDARRATNAEMRIVIASVSRKDGSLGEHLQTLTDDPTRFARLAWKAGHDFGSIKPVWRWSVPSLARAVADEAISAAAVTYLTREMAWRVKQRLERSMAAASRAAFAQYGYDTRRF